MIKNIFKKGFTLIEMLIVIIIIWLLITMFLPWIRNAQQQARDTVRKNYVSKIASAIVVARTEWNNIITEKWSWWCYKDYINIFYKYLDSASNIRDPLPYNITYWTKIWWCKWDLWIARWTDWWYVVVSHLENENWWNFVLDSNNYKNEPYFIKNEVNEIWKKICRKVEKWNKNKQCSLDWNKIWTYNNDDLKVYIQTVR